MKYSRLLILFLTLSPLISLAQNNELINSGELIKKSAALFDSAKYKEAIPLLNKVNRSDTNYVWSLYEKALDLEADSQYSAAIKCCQEALSRTEQREYEPDLLNTYGNTYDDMGEYDKAIQVFDSAIAKYPAYSVLYFNKGIVYMAQKKFADAELWFQKTLLINPYMYSAHFQLGVAALQQGKIVPAFLSFIGYLTVDPSGKYFSRSVKYLGEIAKSTDDIIDLKAGRSVPPDENYQAVEDILLSKIALDPAYKPIISVDDPISRQIQAVFEKLEYSDTNKDFYIQYYLPYFKQVFAPKQFEPFIFHIFSNANADFIQNYLKKNKKEMEQFVSEAGVYFDNLRATRELFYKKRDTITQQYFFDNGKLVGKGTLANKGKILTGPWIAYYGAGNVKATGDYNAAGGRIGGWVYYYDSGRLHGREHYKDGKLDGLQSYYFENGNFSSQSNYSDDKPDGLVTTYYYAGEVKSTANYKAGKKEGEEILYYSNGNRKEVNNYINGSLNGYAREYYKSGNVKDVEQYTNGKGEGPFKSYYESGSISGEGQFSKDVAAGEWKFYYESGKLKEVHSYVNGFEEGPHQEYFENGQPSESFQSKKAKADGDNTQYYDDGKVFAKYFYDKGTIKSIAYFDKAGKQLTSSELKDGSIDAVTYSLDGYKKAHSAYDAKGNLQGPDTLFFPSGKISQINQYKNDTLNGPSVSYYLNGNKKFEINMTDGQDNGYYKSYFANGQLESEGWIQDGDYQGAWSFYNEQGKLTTKSYYLDNDLDGYREEYYPDGKKTLEEKYYRGWLLKMTQYNDAGNVIAVDTFPKSSGKYTLLYPAGQVMAQTMYVNGDFNGPYKAFYFDGSIQNVQFYKKGLLDSTYNSYYYGDRKEEEGQYKLGQRWGLWNFYDEDGKLYSTTEYKNDMKNGVKTYYYPNGTVDYTAVYKDDMLNGDAKKYDTDGTLAYQVIYHDDIATAYTFIGQDGKIVNPVPLSYNNGALKTYYPSGKLSRECTFSDGVVNGRDIIYHVNGQVRSVDTSAYGLYNGNYTEYNPNGKLKSKYFYIQDDANGVCKEFDENGLLKQEMTFEYGTYNGPVKYYDKNGKLAKTFTYYYGKLLAVKNE